MDVQLITPPELSEWAQFIADSPTATGLHAPGWFGVLSELFAVKPLFLRARDDAGRIVGVLPLFRSRNLLFGDVISSLEDGHCAANSDVAFALGRGALDLLVQEGCGCLIYKSNFSGDALNAGWQRVETIKTVVPTNSSVDCLFASLSSNTRRKVRKASREGHNVREANDRLREFYSIFSASLHRLGTPVFGPAVFRTMQRCLGAHMSFYAVERGDRLLGGMVCLKAAQEWTSLYVAVAAEAQQQYASYLLYWAVIEAAARSGVTRFNLGRSIAGSGVHQFKRKWTSYDVFTIYSLFGPAVQRCARRLEAATGQIGWARVFWRRLPTPIVQLAGSYLRRTLPFV